MSPHPEAARLVDLLTARGFTVATAETDTGGSIGAAIVDVPGASAVFPGGVTAYANHPKRSLLDIPEALLHHYGAVSEQAVDAMARGARRAFASDIALAESGITGPGGGNPGRPVGTVWIVCLGPGDRRVAEHHRWPHDRDGNKAATLHRALCLLREAAESAGAPASG